MSKNKSLSAQWLESGKFMNLLQPPAPPEEIQVMDDNEEEEYDSPHGSKWIVAVDYQGRVTILDAPNIHFGFFECGTDAETVGLPYEVEDTDPGVYEWTCSYHEERDWESNLIDACYFEVEEEKLLWCPPQTTA